MQSLESEIKHALDRVAPKTGASRILSEVMAYGVLSPGKRIRPRLALAAGELVGLTREQTLPFAIALEMIHCFTLLHDDLPCMDDDDFRRGRPTAHVKYGEALALLAGDALMPSAVEVFMEAADTVSARPSGARAFHRALMRFMRNVGPRGVVGGQALEMEFESNPKRTKRNDLERIHALKTGALFEAAILVPMDLAGISETQPRGQALQAFAVALGAAFQRADDLEDATNEPPLPHQSLLAFESAQTIRTQTLALLHGARRELELAWGQNADVLTAFSNEVIKKLEATS